ncbi:PKD-like family lipoprotein [Pedobacter insulae]|uniref:PKD-like family protein n=1 Tax=Pedobacter insulae TaxID=414048 RepID=A0A1I2ZZM2_9SPHI|nr:PKD-like family lipoprotein [Pedobacter insulae]SFH43208.1 PKD-like family protein [Pedobacter insulae]
MRTYNKFLLALIATVLFLTSCAKDEGNYTYDHLTTNFVDATSINATFVVSQNDVVNINPTIVAGVSAEKLSYEWRLVQVSFVPNPATGTFVNKVLGTTKNLSFKVVDLPADYTLVLYVKDNANGGITQMIKKSMTIKSYASPGWMVLHGNTTSSDISIVVNGKISSIITNGADYVQANVFSETNGAKMAAEGAGVSYQPNGSVGIFAKTNLGGYRLNGNDLRIMDNYNTMFLDPMPVAETKFQGYDRWSYNELLINNGDLYFNPNPSANIWNKIGLKCFGNGINYVASPYMATIFNFAYYGVIYDTANRRFLYINFNREIKEFLPAGATAAFDLKNTGKEMVYAEHGFDSRWFCVMQSPNDPTTRELFQCKFDKTDNGNIGVARVNISAATELNNAKYFAFGNKANVMYYANDTQIYQNDYAGGKLSTKLLDIASSYPGNVITCMKLLKTAPGVAPAPVGDGKLLYVALYNPATQAGTLLQIDVNEISGAFGTIKPYTGFGKISSMAYKAM